MARRGDNLHKRKDGRWEGRYPKGRDHNGALLYGSVYGKTYAEAKEKLASAQNGQMPQNSPKMEKQLFTDVLDQWLYCNQIRLKGGSVNKYRQIIETHIRKELGPIPVAELTAVAVNSFLEQKLCCGRIDGRGGLSHAYVKSIMLVVNAAIKYAVQEKLCPPLRSPIYKPAEEKREIHALSSAVQQALEDYIFNTTSATAVGIIISLYMGLRIGEVCALRWEDIDFNKQTLTVRHTIARIGEPQPNGKTGARYILDTPKTKASKREIPIPSKVLTLLVSLRRISTSVFVVSEAEGFVNPRTYEYRYKRLLASYHIEPFHYHVLRHTFATRCIESGMDVKTLSEILGHANVNITLNTYVHSSMEMKRTQLEKMLLLTA